MPSSICGMRFRRVAKVKFAVPIFQICNLKFEIASFAANLMNVNPQLLALARAAAARHALDPALVCAVVEQESAWNNFAMRYEPAFRARYVAPLGLAVTEEVTRSISWGLMQVMGQVVRENGFDGKFLSALCEPAVGLDCGCRVLAAKITIATRDAAIPDAGPRQGTAPRGIDASTSTPRDSAAQTSGASAHNDSEAFPPRNILARALALWNGGADPAYPAAVLARMSGYF